MYKTILFDMDGTIADSFMSITEGVAYALSKFGIAVEDKKMLSRFIGPPLKQSFVEFYGFSELMALTAVDYYIKRYEEIWADGSPLFQGIPDVLEMLKAKDVRMAIASSKFTPFIERILSKNRILDYFTFIGGSDPSAQRFEKTEVIRFVLDSLNIAKSEALMVGDRCFDLDAAQTLGIDSVGVLYGYGSRQELESCSSTAILETVEDLRVYLDKNT